MYKKLFYACKRFVHVDSRATKWIKPNGYQTDIIVHNSLAKTKTPLILKHSNIITWYMCGPTVYDSAHIGHACTYVKFDIIRRILSEFFNFNVVQVMGITDIDDKIIKRSNDSGEAWQSIVQRYEKEFLCDLDSLNVLRPFKICNVTNHIPHIVSFIKTIVDKNAAYVGKDGSVYFDTSKCANYGKFGQPQENETSHTTKKSSLDFALWKASKENEPYWMSPWGKGRPGWHIECSAIASSIFGNNIDIHSGGIDLTFPHHENEEAQSCCYHNVEQWVNYWFHTGHLQLPGNMKMSKSLGNTITIPNLLKNYTANQFRMMCLLTDYRKNIIFSDDLIDKAIAITKKIEFFLSDCNDYISGTLDRGCIKPAELLDCLEKTQINVNNALLNDFNTPEAIDSILGLIFEANKMLQEKKSEVVARNAESVAAVSNYLQNFLSKVGVTESISSRQNDDVDQIMQILIDFRSNIRVQALKSNPKDVEILKICDTVRKDLSSNGIHIRDLKEKSTWTISQK